MKWSMNTDVLKTNIIEEVERESGEKVYSCYQCGKCSSGCPIAFAMDYLPNQIIRMVQLGMEEKIFSGNTIWLCVGCETCITRCPREVDLAKIMDALRIIAGRKKVKPLEKEVHLFNQLFLSTVRKFGRVYEMGMVGQFNLRSGQFFKDVSKAPVLYKKGRLKLFPSPADARRIKKIFKRIKKSDEI